MMVAVVMVFGYVPLVKAATTVPRNVQVPMPLPEGFETLERWEERSEWATDFANSLFPNMPDVGRFRVTPRFGSGFGYLNLFHILHYDATLWAWGDPRETGLLGTGNNITINTPVRILENVFQHHGRNAHIALRYDGALLTWGLNSTVSELGRRGTFGSMFVDYCPTPTIVFNDVVAHSFASNANVILRKDGSVWTWGMSFYGQLGDGSITAVGRGRYLPMSIFNNATQINLSGIGQMALHRDGSLWAWGSHTDTANNEIFQANEPIMIVRNFAEPVEFPHTFTADNGIVFTLHGWAPQIPSSPFHTSPSTVQPRNELR